MVLPGFGPRPCSYEVMAAAGCPRRRPTGLSQVNPSLEDGWCMGQAAAARNIASKRALLEHSLRENRALLRDFIISVVYADFGERNFIGNLIKALNRSNLVLPVELDFR